ncbi:FH2-domain-containing protein [Fomitiporia mediterranea MF3/22]|uniref:FH2-domain-containing protein n=1 Tax=Fomitiporia mediterranea (strain MF3/22) TaxID=694068 RepID=UPI0004408CA1|nr:FH2-domain-containing protein [Fomitiporia mediterranea MF3/22]EJD01599.1 FH2-domain-containing protein [Fomitiporia mediterranea MF3/22]
MADNTLIAPVISPAGTVYFASVNQDATAQDVIASLIQPQDVRDEILGDLPESGWDLQRVRKEHSGRVWEEEELESIGPELLQEDDLIAPILASKPKPSAPERHFSSFPLTSHLHSPVIRLVSRHPLLRLKFSFLRVPEIHDGFEWTVYLTLNSTVHEVISSTCEQLGLVKALPIAGGGTIDYAIETFTPGAGADNSTRLEPDVLLSTILGNAKEFRFCVPDEWYRRPNSRVPSVAPSESTLRRLSDLEAEEEEGEGTARQKQASSSTPSSPTAKPRSGSPDSTGTFSSKRFSSIFDGWLGSATPESPMQETVVENSNKRPIVSEPMAVENHTASSDTESEKSCDEEDFERMIDDLGLRGEKREAMRNMPADRKRYLLRQNRQMRSTVGRESSQSPAQSATIGPARAAPLIPALVPSLTGDGIMKRFSISGWGSSSASETPPDVPSSPKINGTTYAAEKLSRRESSPAHSDIAPLQPQTTGGLWGSWWASSGTESWMSSMSKSKATPSKDNSSTVFYADGLRSRRPNDIKLVKHLISLRVHLSTAKVSWVERFLGESKGMDALASLLASLVGKGGKRKKLSDTEESVLYEVVKCLRVLLNTEPGFNLFLASPMLVTHVTYTLHTDSLKLRTLTCELLAAICILSVTHGHHLVLAAFSDYRVAHEEAFRFEELIDSLRLSSEDDDDSDAGVPGEKEEEGAWEARTAAMTLVNALTTCPESLEERIQLREEFSRRGLNEIIVTLRYIRPPESIVTQIDVYTEEKFEDEEDLRERTRSLFKDSEGSSELEAACAVLNDLSLRQEVLRPSLIEALHQLGALLTREITLKFKADYLTIVNKLLEQCIAFDELGVDWLRILGRFVSQISPVIDQTLEIQVASDDDVSSDFQKKEMEELRNAVEGLEKERVELKDEIAMQRVEIDTLKTLPTTNAPSKGGKESIQGLVQRLVSKEKQVVQLRAEVERLKLTQPSETRDTEERLKHERDRVKWNALSEEIVDLKKKNEEAESLLQRKDKEVLYLKRAMESVYSRLHNDVSTREAQPRQTQIRDIDAEKIAASAVEALSAKDDEISVLRAEVQKLQEELKAKPRYVTENDFKKGVSPPPPPPPSAWKGVKQQVSPPPAPSSPVKSPPNSPLGVLPSSTSPPPPPPPQRGRSSSSTPNSAPPPPPPPPSGLSIPPPPPPPPSSAPGMPPPPPPPPGMSRKGAPIPNIVLPGKRLRPFFWTKVTVQAAGPSVWDDVLSTGSSIDLDLKELEETFSLEAAPSKVASSPQNSPRKTSVTTLLDTTRANNILIMLTRIKPSLADIKRALLTIDDSLLSVDDLKAISRHLPTTDEMKRIDEFGDVKQLAKADQYLKELSGIPRLSERINCMLYRRKLEIDIEETRPELDIVRQATKELRASTRFKQVLKTVLTVGNALNGSSFRGNARGFQLEALLKMKETKTVKSSPDCPTLLHYVSRVLLRSDPEVVNFLDDLPHLEAAARVSMQTVSAAVTTLASGLAQVQSEIKLQRQSRNVHSDDRFVQVMEPFVVQVTSSIQALENMNRAVESDLKSLMAYYGEMADSPEGPKPEDFFSLIVSFSSALRKAALEVHDAQTKAQQSAASAITNGKKTAVPPSTNSDQSTIQAKKPPPSTPSATSAAPPTSGGGFLVPPPPPIPAESHAADSRHRSVGRGELDATIKSMRKGVRRERNARPLSKMFLDGS